MVSSTVASTTVAGIRSAWGVASASCRATSSCGDMRATCRATSAATPGSRRNASLVVNRGSRDQRVTFGTGGSSSTRLSTVSGLSEDMEYRHDGTHGVADEGDGALGLERQESVQHLQLRVDGRRVRRRGEGPAVAQQVWYQHPAALRQQGADQAEVERRPAKAVQAHHELGSFRRAVLGEVDGTVEIHRARVTAWRPQRPRHPRLTRPESSRQSGRRFKVVIVFSKEVRIRDDRR